MDNRKKLFPIQDVSLIQKICHRQWGIGADGFILLESSTQADFRMRIFNADGYEAEMCGNGIRCLAKFIQELGFVSSSYYIETYQRMLFVSQDGLCICVEMGVPTDIEWNIKILVETCTYSFHYLNTGVPHVVLFVEDLESLDLQQIGPFIRHHPIFSPQGVNVNLAQKISEKEILIRTFERGVERETLACGTGATAVALAAAYCYGLQSPINIRVRSKEILKISFQLESLIFSQVTMSGPAYCTYRGEIHLPDNSSKRNSFSIASTKRIQ